ncbi:hypothetical protein [Alistipes sp.]|uniref:hypothetical protein n=1 Tax=Alistipes sp. TaxID=1872444 RepID=UPI003AEF37C0
MEYDANTFYALRELTRIMQEHGVAVESEVLRVACYDRAYALKLIDECRQLGVAAPRSKICDELEIYPTENINTLSAQDVFGTEYKRQQEIKARQKLDDEIKDRQNKELKRNEIISWLALGISILSLILAAWVAWHD